jgi:hypothetical protein
LNLSVVTNQETGPTDKYAVDQRVDFFSSSRDGYTFSNVVN